MFPNCWQNIRTIWKYKENFGENKGNLGKLDNLGKYKDSLRKMLENGFLKKLAGNDFSFV